MQLTINAIRPTSARVLRNAGLTVAALALSISSAYATGTFTQPDIDFKGNVSTQGGVVYAGGEANVSGRAFTPGQEIVLRQNGQVISGQTPVVADKDGAFKTTVAIPADAEVGLHDVVLEAVKPNAASMFEIKVSPKVPLSGQDAFELQAQHMAPGVYQSAYSAKNNKLFVTSAVGRPPVKESQLLKVDPKTLAIEARITPAADTARDGQVQAVYGVGVDDANDTVWVTNTRSNTVAVYRQSDLSLVKQFPNGTVSHARDVVIDAKAQRAYASSPGSNVITVFDTKALEVLPELALRGKGREQVSLMSLAIDPANGKLYTISSNTNELFIVDLKKGEAEHVFALPGVRGASGVAIDAKNQQVYVSAQGSDNLLIVNARDGSVLHTIPVGAGALNVAFDPARELAYVASRGAGTVTVVNPKGQIVANLDGGSSPNHVSVDGKGNAYLLNKAKGKDDPTADRISRIHAK